MIRLSLLFLATISFAQAETVLNCYVDVTGLFNDTFNGRIPKKQIYTMPMSLPGVELKLSQEAGSDSLVGRTTLNLDKNGTSDYSVRIRAEFNGTKLDTPIEISAALIKGKEVGSLRVYGSGEGSTLSKCPTDSRRSGEKLPELCTTVRLNTNEVIESLLNTGIGGTWETAIEKNLVPNGVPIAVVVNCGLYNARISLTPAENK